MTKPTISLQVFFLIPSITQPGLKAQICKCISRADKNCFLRNTHSDLRTGKRLLRVGKSGRNGLFSFSFFHFLLLQPQDSTGLVGGGHCEGPYNQKGGNHLMTGTGPNSMKHISIASFPLSVFPPLGSEYSFRKCLEEQEVRFLAREEKREDSGR